MSQLIKYSVSFIMLLALIVPLQSCDDNNNQIPFVTVDAYVNITLPSNQALQAVGGWVYFNGGSKGLIIYRKSIDEFVAYERHATYMPENNCYVEVNPDYVTCKDICSESTYLLFDGTVSQGPAVVPLKQYQTSFDGAIYVHVFN